MVMCVICWPEISPVKSLSFISSQFFYYKLIQTTIAFTINYHCFEEADALVHIVTYFDNFHFCNCPEILQVSGKMHEFSFIIFSLKLQLDSNQFFCPTDEPETMKGLSPLLNLHTFVHIFKHTLTCSSSDLILLPFPFLWNFFLTLLDCRCVYCVCWCKCPLLYSRTRRTSVL